MLKNPLHLTLRRAKAIDSMNVNVIDYACLKGKQNGITKEDRKSTRLNSSHSH